MCGCVCLENSVNTACQQFAVHGKLTLMSDVRYVPGDGATRAGPEELAALLWESRTDTAVRQTNTDSGKEL